MKSENNGHRLQASELAIYFFYIFSLWGFVVAQPIYADLFRDGGFFRWYQNTVPDILIALVTLSFILPGFIILCLWFCSRVHASLTARFCLMILLLLLGGFILLLLSGFPEIPFFVKLLIGITCGTWLTRKMVLGKERVFFLYFLVPGAIVFPLWFWITCPLTTPFQPGRDFNWTAGQELKTSATPVVMIIFDELPLNSLLNRDGSIDSIHFPNFAALAKNASWFPNTVTVHTITRGAVPAILTGRYPEASLDWAGLLLGRIQYACRNPVPTVTAFPNTLFNLLGSFYAMHVYESRIYLCNLPSCRVHKLKQRSVDRLNRMFSRITQEYVFKILFNSRDFYQLENQTAVIRDSEDKLEEESPVSHTYDLDLFQQFLQAIHTPKQSENTPPFYFIHPILPHSPWEYYPSGLHYSPWSPSTNPSDDVLCRQSPSLLTCQNPGFDRSLYRRHLLQVGFVDNLLGQTISRLKSVGLYDKSLIIVTADHGISFSVGQSRRRIDVDNYGDIMPVPLFIKRPGQVHGQADERHAETVDILPTIASQLHLTPRWHLDGQDLFKPLQARDRRTHFICSPAIKVQFSASQIEDALKESLLQKPVLEDY